MKWIALLKKVEIRDLFQGKYKWFIIPLIAWISLWIILSIIKPDFLNPRKIVNKKNCEKAQNFKAMLIYGVIIKKYSNERGDKHFNYRQDKTTYESYHALLNAAEYDFNQVGDSIIKEKGSLDLKISRLGIDTSFHVDLYFNENLL